MGKRITYEEVKENIESKGWTLQSDSYKNLDTGLTVLCPQGHQVSVTYGDWRKTKNYDCPICIRQPIINKLRSFVNVRDMKAKLSIHIEVGI